MVLYRSAAFDTTLGLGEVIVDSGRERMFPLLMDTMQRAIGERELAGDPRKMVETFLALVLRDAPLRRVTRAIDQPDSWFCAARAVRAVDKLQRLFPAYP